MKIKLGKRSFTLLIIPDANSKVKRFRFSALLLYSLTISFMIIGLSFVAITLTMNITGVKNLNDKKAIANELAVKTLSYETTITNKEETIENLQISLIELSEQAEAMKMKVEELKAFEEEIRSISSADQATSDKRDVTIAAFHDEDDTAQSAMGGAPIEANDEDITSLVIGTQQTLNSLVGDVGSLKLQLSDTKDSMIEQIQLMKITPSIWPTVSQRISSRYGFRKDPFSRRASFHAGIDIAGKTSDPVYSTADGVVTSAEYTKSYGNHIIVKHPSGVSTSYSHLKKILVTSGQVVKQGEEIGLLGSTGRSTGPHLHYEILKSGKTIDPMPYLEGK